VSHIQPRLQEHETVCGRVIPTPTNEPPQGWGRTLPKSPSWAIKAVSTAFTKRRGMQWWMGDPRLRNLWHGALRASVDVVEPRQAVVIGYIVETKASDTNVRSTERAVSPCRAPDKMETMGNGFEQGQHICAVYETPEEQIAIAAEYLADGLRAGERAFYVAENGAALTRFRTALRAVGIDADAELARGALIQKVHGEAHLAGGQFDSERMMHLLNAEVEAALSDGFAGLRTCGDMSWLLGDPPGARQVLEYEVFLNQFFTRVHASGMCQYDRRRLPPFLVDAARAAHPTAIIDGAHRANPFYKEA
jgi:hypothetical protein